MEKEYIAQYCGRNNLVDVSSAAETDGHKDGKKIQEFIERVREYE